MRRNEIAFGVLAGGESSRMGKNKAELILNGKTFLEYVLEAGEGFAQRTVSLAKGEQKNLPEGVGTVFDELPGMGPIEGIRQLLLSCKYPACMIVGTDMPFLSADLLRKLAELYSGKGNLVLTCGGKMEPLCSIYSTDCVQVIEAIQEQGFHRITRIYESIQTNYISVEELGFPKSILRNINTAAEYSEIAIHL